MRKAGWSAARGAFLLLFVLYLLVLFRVTVFRGTRGAVQSMNVIPFLTIGEYVQSVLSGARMVGLTNLIGNIYLFVPLGCISALLFPAMRGVARASALSLGLSVSIELLQAALACGAADVDDVLLNVLGGALGYGVYRLLARLREKTAVLVGGLMVAATCFALFAVHGHPFGVGPPPQMVAGVADVVCTGAADEPPAPSPSVDPQPAPGETSTADAWYLILVNRRNPIPEGYEAALTELSNGQLVDSRVYPALSRQFCG